MQQFITSTLFAIIAMLFTISRDKFKKNEAFYNYRYRNFLAHHCKRGYNFVMLSKNAIIFYALAIVTLSVALGCFFLACYIRWVELAQTKTFFFFAASAMAAISIGIIINFYLQLIQEASIYQHNKKNRLI